MAIAEKELNQKNSGYGDKSGRYHRFQATLNLTLGGGKTDSAKEYYDRGRYSEVIKHCFGYVITEVKSIDSLSKMEESDLAGFYYMGKAYLKLGEVDNAIGCFHIVYSQAGFKKYMLENPIEFSKLVGFAHAELEEIAEEYGEDKVNNFDVASFMNNVIKAGKGGCFIATAACGTPLAEEVVWLSRFRDDILARKTMGVNFINFYYKISPPIASWISRYNLAKVVIRTLIIRPLSKLARLFTG